jgi:dTDP-glucose pyrophosphorylase/CBS domain-containing protein
MSLVMATGIDGLRVSPTDSLKHVIAVIDNNRRQFAVVVDENDRLMGVVADGDIRRAILRGATLDSPASSIMNSTPKTALTTDSSVRIFERMAEGDIRHLPLLDRDGVIMSVATMDDFVHPERTTTPIILMAGGKGQRLYPLTKDLPKPMLPVGETPILGIILERIRAQGFRDVRISVNYLADVIKDYVGDGSAFGLDVTYIYEDAPLGTAGAIATQAGLITEPFIVMNSDLLTHVDLRDLVSFHQQNAAEATVGVREYVVEIPFGVVSVRDSLVTELTEKPLHRSLVSAGIYALNAEVLGTLTVGEYCDMPTLLTDVMTAGKNVAAFPIFESWLDVGRPEDLSRARDEATGSVER